MLAQGALSEALDELWWLNKGPIGTVAGRTASSIGLKTILKFNIHNLIPFEEGSTFRQLATQTGLPEKKLTRLLRSAMTEHLFQGPSPGHVKHTIATKALVAVPGLATWAQMSMQDVAPTKLRTVDAVAEWPTSEEPQHSGFSLANDTDLSMFEYLEQHSQRMTQFKAGMQYLQSWPGLKTAYLCDSFDWAALGWATVVDVGGSHGQVSIDLARRFPDLRFVVQDLASVASDTKGTLPAELEHRVEFMTHDFSIEQPVKDAAVYLFRWILHDCSDKYCIRILRALIPALKPGAWLVLNERCLEQPCTATATQESFDRNADMVMLAMNHSQERDQQDWEELFKTAAPGYEIQYVKRMPGALLDTIVVRWNPAVSPRA